MTLCAGDRGSEEGAGHSRGQEPLERHAQVRLRTLSEGGGPTLHEHGFTCMHGCRYLEHGAGSRGVTPLLSQLVSAILSRQAIPDLHHNTASLR